MAKKKTPSINDIYYDCASSTSTFGDRQVTASWTPWGIKQIDSEYSRRIQNIGRPVTKLILIERNPHNLDGTINNDWNTYRTRWWDDYTESPLDQDFKSYDRSLFIHDEDPSNIYTKIKDPRSDYEKERGFRNFQEIMISHKEYCYTHPTYSAKHRGEDPKALEQEILDNPHLHPMIKENLLGNLKTIIEKYLDDK